MAIAAGPNVYSPISASPIVEVNIEDDEDAAELVQTLNNGMRSVPTIVFPDGSVLVEPSNAALAAVLARYATAANWRPARILPA